MTFLHTLHVEANCRDRASKEIRECFKKKTKMADE